MAQDATGSPTALGIPTYNVDDDAPTGEGFNAAMAALDTLITARVLKPSGIAAGDVPVWNGTQFVVPSGTRTGTKFLRDDGSWALPVGGTPTTNAQSGTTYTLVIGDASNVVELSNAAAITATVPPNSSVAFPVGSSITLLQTGAGQVTVAAGAGVTVNANPGLKLVGQWAGAALLKRATDTWVLIGNISS